MSPGAWESFRDDVIGLVTAGVPARAHREGLRRLLVHAVEHSPFHRRRLEGVDLDDLSALPVMTKAQMMDELDDVFTDRRLTRSAVESALAATTSRPLPIVDDYVALASGGCSGNRGLFVYDRPAFASFVTSIARPPIEVTLPPGMPAVKPRVAMVAAGSAVHATGIMAVITENPSAPGLVDAIPATLPIAEIVRRLNAIQPSILGGYASMLVRLAAELRAGRLSIAPAQVHSTSETLHADMRSAIRETFRAPVFDGFGSTEGLFGKSGPDTETMVFNTDMCIVELVDEANQPVAPGVPSARVLLTNLYNFVQPLIRYELTDTFIRQPDAEHGHLRACVCGRSDDILRYDENDIHPITIRSVMVRSPEVTEYQVRQIDRGVEIFVVSEGLDSDDLRTRLESALKDAGLPHPVVVVRAVSALDRHPVTGKLRTFIPLSPSAVGFTATI